VDLGTSRLQVYVQYDSYRKGDKITLWCIGVKDVVMHLWKDVVMHSLLLVVNKNKQ